MVKSPESPSDCVLFVSSDLNNNQWGNAACVFALSSDSPRVSGVQSWVQMCCSLSRGIVWVKHDRTHPAGDLIGLGHCKHLPSYSSVTQPLTTSRPFKRRQTPMSLSSQQALNDQR